MRFIKIFPLYFLLIVFGCNVSSKSKTASKVSTNEKTSDVKNVSFKTTSKPKGIDFIEDDWNSALQKAKKENKLIFVDIYATWCGPCKMLKNFTFTDASVGNFFNSNFINVSVDGEKGVGPQLAQQYAIEGYPTLIITDAQGKPVLYTVGYIPASDLLKFGNQALKKSKS